MAIFKFSNTMMEIDLFIISFCLFIIHQGMFIGLDMDYGNNTEVDFSNIPITSIKTSGYIDESTSPFVHALLE
jgi:hypothetical protein